MMFKWLVKPKDTQVGSFVPKTSLLVDIFSSSKNRWVQRLTGIHRIHDIQYSFGWKFPFTDWCYFEAYEYTVDFVFRSDYGQKKIRPAHWKRRTAKTYHNCTLTNRGLND